MARPPRRKRGTAGLQCNTCDHRFEGRVVYVSIETTDRGTVGWSPEQPRVAERVAKQRATLGAPNNVARTHSWRPELMMKWLD